MQVIKDVERLLRSTRPPLKEEQLRTLTFELATLILKFGADRYAEGCREVVLIQRDLDD